MTFLDEIDEEAKKIGAVNTIVNRNGKLIGYNTDSYGAMIALFEKLISIGIRPPYIAQLPSGQVDFSGKFLSGKKVVVLGAGGASRAICFGVLKHGGELTILNRHVERAQEIADDFANFFPDSKITIGNSDNFDAKNCDILINTTPCGMTPHENETPLPDLKEKLKRATESEALPSLSTNLSVAGRQQPHTGPRPVVMDIVYRPRETRFIHEAKEAGCKVITGERMFLHQAARGFELWTGQKAPFEAMEKALYAELKPYEQHFV